MEIKLTETFFYFRKKTLINLMRTFIFLCCFTAFSLTPGNVSSQNAKIKIDADRTITVDQVFEIIKEQTNYRFIYRSNLFDGLPKVNLKKGITQVNKLLEKSLSAGNFNFDFTTRNTIIIKGKAKKKQEKITVTGVVTDDEGEPLVDATIIVKGTVKGAATNFEGQYSISTEKDAVLVFHYYGYKVQEIAVNNRNKIDVKLLPDVEKLKEVVVVSNGYQNISKERAAGAYVNINTNKIAKQVTTDVLQSLEGLAPGLTINNSGNGIGNTDNIPSLFIRGIGSFGNTAPLIILDGFPVSNDQLNLINTQDVDSVNILKDAAAASIWGSGAANGVIVITTKKGKGQKTNFTFRQTTSFKERPSLSYQNLSNSLETIDYERDVFFNDPSNLPVNHPVFAQPLSYDVFHDFSAGNISQVEMESRLASLASHNNRNDIEKAFLNAPITNTTNFSFSGNTDKLNYFGSIAHITKEGDFVGDNSKRTNIVLNSEYQFFEKTKVDLKLNYLAGKNDNSPLRNLTSVETNVPSILLISPYQRLYDSRGNSQNIRRGYTDSFNQQLINAGGKSLSYNPINDLSQNKFLTNQNTIRISTSIKQELLKGLSATFAYQYLKDVVKEDNLYKDNSYFNRKLLNDYSSATFVGGGTSGDLAGIVPHLPDGSILRNNDINRTSNISRLQLNYSGSFSNGKHQINALLGAERRKNVFENEIFTRFGYNESNLLFSLIDQNPNVGTNPFSLDFSQGLTDYFSKQKIDERISSYYFNAGYTFNRKYDINFSGRIDRSSQFSNEEEFLGSVGLKWNLSHEDFFNVSWVNNLQFRATWGILGNTPSIGTASLTTIARPMINPSTGLQGLIITNPANKDLTFETVETKNFAVDFGLFNNRISGSVDYYIKESSNVISQGEIDPTNGFFTITKNVADILNEGYEINLNTKNIIGNNFSWTTGINYSHYSNKVEQSFTDKNQAFGASAIQLEGYPAYSVFGYRFAGLNASGDAEAFYTDASGNQVRTATESDIAFEDLKHIGSLIPTTTIGLENTFTYKGFQLYARLAYNGGNVLKLEEVRPTDINSNSNRDGFFFGYNKNTLDFWKNPGDENTTNTPSLNSSVANTNLRELSNLGYDDADYIKLRQVILSYAIDNKWLKQTPFTAASVYFQGDNLWYWAKNNYGIDPEAYLGQSGQRTLELTPTYSLGATLKF